MIHLSIFKQAIKFIRPILWVSLLLPAPVSHAKEGEIVNTSVIWKTPSSEPELYSHNLYAPLWHYNKSTYFVWIDAETRPWVTKITDGNPETVPLDPNPDYKVTRDSHNRFTMGIDKKGFIHISGDMHNYSYQTNNTSYPARYRQQDMLYWKSKQPENISAGFDFVGGRNAPTAIPGTGFTYGRFFVDNNHELYYSSRVKAILASHTSGEMGYGLYRYNADTQVWSALGGKAEDTRPGTYFDVILWENAGVAPDEWYQGFLTNLKFDAQNRLHFAASINSDSTLPGNNRLVYAFSNDGGATWNKVGGGKISHLPLRATDGLTNQADIVDSVSTPPFISSFTKVIADRHGKPGIITANWNGPSYTWNGTDSWINQKDKFFLAETVDINNEGNLVFTSSGSAKLLIAHSFDSKPTGYDFKGYDRYHAIDEYSLRKTGVAYGVGIKTSENAQTILKTTIEKAPLPEGWHSKDISATGPMYEGRSGYRKGKFIVNDYGTHIDNSHDSFHYVYKPMHGNGSITAKVTLETISNHGRAGVMMRESLAFNARDVIALFAPGRTSSIFGFRSATGGHMGNNFVPNTSGNTWVRLEREGNVFTGFVSSDGKNWTPIGKTTQNLPLDIYVGLASASYHKYGMQTSTYELVNSPSLG